MKVNEVSRLFAVFFNEKNESFFDSEYFLTNSYSELCTYVCIENAHRRLLHSGNSPAYKYIQSNLKNMPPPLSLKDTSKLVNKSECLEAKCLDMKKIIYRNLLDIFMDMSREYSVLIFPHKSFNHALLAYDIVKPKNEEGLYIQVKDPTFENIEWFTVEKLINDINNSKARKALVVSRKSPIF